jgi:hypothetical protein
MLDRENVLVVVREWVAKAENDLKTADEDVTVLRSTFGASSERTGAYAGRAAMLQADPRHLRGEEC